MYGFFVSLLWLIQKVQPLMKKRKFLLTKEEVFFSSLIFLQDEQPIIVVILSEIKVFIQKKKM
jgi:hypothetical protein